MTIESFMSQLPTLRKMDLAAVSLPFKALSNESRVSILNLLRNGPKTWGKS